ncbi:helix-turn-helix domain-containing protein [Streptomyces durbertensis]|uniref:Helix-turn-helix domain-containing protein n=1 Tax=Streptomyces durbertensis TaxID=2448886 RepID=A0ABR6EFK8_9ACTN|nr:helix-turn-helix domain-containing protein [Streptomyces durbertensis]MBB1244092.1 helix-turn-helix domain-containing protein [Streptomyces durbertensis]
MTDQPGALLRELRKRARLTQEQLAERSAVSVRTIRRLETGKSTDHRVKTLHLLADALEAGPEERRRLIDTLDRAPAASASEPAAPAPAPAPVAETGATPPPASATPAPAPPTPASPVPSPPAVDGVLSGAADSLAREVRRRWRREEEQRRVHDPFPLPVRWRPAPASLTDHPENVQRLEPGATAVGVDLSGDVRSVAETYRRVGSGRLVILGRAGSGKSVLAVRFALDLLAARAPADPVPVIVSLGSWDPAATTVRDLLVGRLLRDHPHLARRVAGGTTQAAALVDADLILPVLDGFDEIAQGLRGAALDALNDTSLPLVLTSRRYEYEQVVTATRAPLVWAAGIELADLTVDDLAAYLPRTARPVAHDAPRGTGVWDEVLDALRTGDAAPGAASLADVLRTPLMVILARTMYSEAPDRNPAELLDTTRFPTPSDLEEHLLAGFVPTVYRRRAPERSEDGRRQRTWDVERARRWLGYLAHSLDQGDGGRQDLAWWRLSRGLPTWTRVLHVTLTSALCMAAATWLVGMLAQPWESAELFGPDAVLVQGTLVGMIAGAAFGLVYAVMAALDRVTLQPSRVRLRLPAADRRVVRRPLRAFTSRFGFMLLAGAVLGIGYAWAHALLRVLYLGSSLSDPGVFRGVLINMLVFALIFGLSAGLVFGLLAAFEAPMDVTAAATPLRLLSANRVTAGHRLLVLVPAVTLGVGLCGFLVVGLFQDLLGPLVWRLADAALLGAVGGLGGASSYVLVFTAWGQWLTLSRVWLPLTGRLPWNTVAFLEDAYRRGVLRQTGAVYQFRHIRLQRHLAQSYRLSPRPADQATMTRPRRTRT